MIDLTPNLLDNYKKKPGVVGRYSCSKIYALLRGWTSPQQYLEGEIIDFKSAKNMWLGTKKHLMIQELMPEWDQEINLVKKVKDFEVVGMADLINDDEIIDLKTSLKLIGAKPWSVHQIRLYLTIFEREKGRLMQPIWKDDKLILKELGVYSRDDDWFNKEMDKLEVIHKQIKEYETRRNN